MATKKFPNRRNIDPPSWVAVVLTIEAIRKGFKGMKPYVEHLLEQHAKELQQKEHQFVYHEEA